MSDGRAPVEKARRQSAASSDHPRVDFTRASGELGSFLDQAVRAMQMALEWEISAPKGADGGDAADIVVRFHGEDESLLLENNAELLLALEYIAHRWLRLDPRLHDRVRFDCGDYRATRLDELKLSARVAAQRVRETGEAHRFRPMSSRERRLIHLELAGAPGVRTISEGVGDRRQLVIYPATRK